MDNLEAKAGFFFLVGHLLLQEPTEQSLALLAQVLDDPLPFTEEGAELKKGAELLQKAIALSSDRAGFEAIQYDWLRLFVGVEKVLAPPWASVYEDPTQRQLFQEGTLEIRRMYAKRGFLPELYRQEPDDHIGLELLFLAKLIEAEMRAEDTVDDQALLVSKMKWSTQWRHAVEKTAATPYCLGLAMLAEQGLAEYAAERNFAI